MRSAKGRQRQGSASRGPLHFPRPCETRQSISDYFHLQDATLLELPCAALAPDALVAASGGARERDHGRPILGCQRTWAARVWSEPKVGSKDLRPDSRTPPSSLQAPPPIPTAHARLGPPLARSARSRCRVRRSDSLILCAQDMPPRPSPYQAGSLRTIQLSPKASMPREVGLSVCSAAH